ncbi:MAG: hypothetical protein COW73_05250 [Nitrospirae bacterium CG18_big_fil_WC_8_21_14_2_50_70_55]|nr:response regulator [Deltaproteobacteria bacterium]OIP67406.1 MAG: hypothetical protein AUK30_00805 [Nitrospirae bacterium CG2_30_70_394]PIQ05621.1 MAG: hypothetical protein COW73_05250 [Nitrospirae bacterium CG18_big_fil_WC_8_21_14_2_50_70_55]PIU79728.1 MAG: hypothetical protein COS73_03005 [Nitrospirae bacterium CG06_land_8_20_14_3_00_70_43]PIW83435.1 MAG: hypothetical protein COZ96_03395 [Nitrospirae bacterium CG_4_8_14_3_um_filter_70_85]PIX84316.1 MAG: hypothetical protein COZ33_00865 [N
MTETPATARSGAKILLVDDTPANLDLLRDILAPAGYRIFFATSGEQAVRVATEARPDLILLDVNMPQMDGFMTCTRLKQVAEVAEIPVIFVTARTDVEDLARGFAVGSVDYITKPIKPPEVEARVRTHLRIQGLIAELRELSATKDRFFSIVAKELSPAVAALAEAGQTLAAATAHDHPTPEPGALLAVTTGAESVLTLVENLLEWPRVGRGQKLDLYASPVTDATLASFAAGLPELRFLSLADTRVTDAGLAHVARLTGLHELHLDNTPISDAGVAQLAPLTDLRILDLKGTRVTDSGLAIVRRLPHLQALYLTRAPITDAGLAHVATLAELRTLILWDTPITDAGLLHLAHLARLTELILWNTRVTDAGVAALATALPACDISAHI